MRTVELPEELVEEILTRLPVHTLLRFRCVSKTWRSLIDGPSFVKSHLSNNPNSKIYAFHSLHASRIRLVEVNLTLGVVSLSNSPDRLVFKLPMSPPSRHMMTPLMIVVGSCDGLICIAHRHWFTEIVFINPSTREYRLLPPVSKPFLSCEVFGMCYDSSADEYKVVLIPDHKRNEIYIYGSTSNTWRQVDVSTNYTSSIDPARVGCYGVYAHGALHWTMCRSEQTFWIAAFDLFHEKFTVVGYTRDFFENPDYFRLKVVGGQLCLICQHNTKKDEKEYTVIWVMKEYGVRESWSILASFDGHVEPTAFSTCRKHLLVGGITPSSRCGSFHWYDLDKKFMGIECTISGSLTKYHTVCQQSLIRLEEKLG